MKYIDESRDASLTHSLLDEIRRTATRPWKIMEVCGGQTHSILKNGLDQLLPAEVELVHGPGCPVCVTPLELIDKAIALASRPDVIFVSHGTGPPAISALLESPDVRVDGSLAAGHVCTVMGYWEYEPLVEKYNVPIVVTGFEPVDIARGVLMCVKQLEEGRAEVENAYARAVRREGNRPAPGGLP